MRVDFVSLAELVVDVGALTGRLSLPTLSGQSQLLGLRGFDIRLGLRRTGTGVNLGRLTLTLLYVAGLLPCVRPQGLSALGLFRLPLATSDNDYCRDDGDHHNGQDEPQQCVAFHSVLLGQPDWLSSARRLRKSALYFGAVSYTHLR